MDSYDKTYLDIDELAKKIEERIKDLESQEKQEVKSKEVEVLDEYTDKKTEKNISDLDRIIKEIDERIAKFEKDEKAKEKEELNVADLTNKINKKLEKLDDIETDDLGKTIYDLSGISNAINETIKKLEEKKKRKKELKAKYCDLARKNANKKNKKCYKK